MPIRPEHRFFYSFDWRELSMAIGFGRAQGRCESCGRPHGQMVYHLGDGRWRDAEADRWRDGWGRRNRIRSGTDILGRARRTHVVLAAAHWDHDTANNAEANLVAFCGAAFLRTCDRKPTPATSHHLPTSCCGR